MENFSFILAQIIGIFVTCASVATLQFKSMKWILIGEIAINILVAISCALLGGLSGAGVCITATVQAIILVTFQAKNVRFPALLTLAFMGIYVYCSVATYKSAIDVLPCIAACAYAMSVIQKKASIFRIYTFINSFLWLIYNLNLGAYTNILTYAILMFSNVISMLRLDREDWKMFFETKNPRKKE